MEFHVPQDRIRISIPGFDSNPSVFGACLLSEPIISTVSIHRSIYPIHLSSSIHLYPSICPCIHVSNVSKGHPKCLVELVDFSRNPKRYHVCCPCQAAKCGLGEAECLLFSACGLGTLSMCVCVWHSCSARSFSFRLCTLVAFLWLFSSLGFFGG